MPNGGGGQYVLTKSKTLEKVFRNFNAASPFITHQGTARTEPKYGI